MKSHQFKLPAVLGGQPAFDTPVYVTKSSVPDMDGFTRRISPAFHSRTFTNEGPLAVELSNDLQRKLGVTYCSLFSSGTQALIASLKSLNISGEVITTPFTFPATVHAIVLAGLTPVFCDIDAKTYNLDVDKVEQTICNQTVAIVPVHIFGNPCDVAGFERLSANHDLRLVYDAAHAFGVTYLGKSLLNWGDMSVLSFHATKVFHTAEGGAVVVNDESLFEKLSLFRNFGIVDENVVDGVGFNGKMSELHAAFGLSLLDTIDEEIRKRQSLVRYYRNAFSDIDGVRMQKTQADVVPNGFNFSIEIDEEQFGLSRDMVYQALRAEQIVARRYFHPLCTENLAYKDLESSTPTNIPNAIHLASRILSLPLFADLSTAQIDKIVAAVLAIKQNAGHIESKLKET